MHGKYIAALDETKLHHFMATFGPAYFGLHPS